jgi:O-glycosyl hydrolase
MNYLLQRMKILGLIISFLLLAHACEKENGGNNNTSDNYISLSLNLNDKKQQIQSFGASDAWSIQFVGKNWPLEKREQIAELLFSTDTDENQNPKGIGLSGWRFNIGGGSAEQASPVKLVMNGEGQNVSLTLMVLITGRSRRGSDGS